MDGGRIVLPSGLLLISSKLGYILTGKYPDPTERNSGDDEISSCLVMTQNDGSCLKDLWALETIGIRDPIQVNEDDKALETFNNTIRYQAGRYCVTLPWKFDDVQLPSNFDVAFGRMKSLSRRLQADKSLLQQYCDIIRTQHQAGIIELIDNCPTKDSDRIHYLPHHPVITPLKTTTKVRIVYDPTIKVKKDVLSLNECLHRGPIVLPNMCGILIRFRLYFIAVLADIEKAFLQIGVQEHDRNVMRFLWYTDPTRPERVEGNLSTYRFCCVPFGQICSPFLLEGTLRFHLKGLNSPIANAVSDNIYVDNVCVGATTVEEALSLYKEAKGIFSEASMNLREWTSNCTEFLDCLPEKERLSGKVIKVFGLVWNRIEDYLQIPTFKGSPDEVFTKRQVLSDVSKLYDPLGLIGPVTLPGKLFVQKLWFNNKKFNWDESLPQCFMDEWRNLTVDWQKLYTLQIPRYIGQSDKDVRYQLIVFCDASAKAYAAAVYLRTVNKHLAKTNLVFSKLRLAPLNSKKHSKVEQGQISLPRLELLAVLIGVRAIEFVTRELKLPVTKRMVFSDSECVLHWIKSTKQLPVFVQNRVKEIRKEQDLIFSYVSSCQNPADFATRGLTVSEIKGCSLWWNGPDWLQLQEESWPTCNLPDITPERLEYYLSQTKMVGSSVMYEASCVVNEAFVKQNYLSPFEIDETKYSSFWKLLRITVLCLKFIKKRVLSKCSEALQDGILQKHVILKGVFGGIREQSLYFGEIKMVTLLWLYTIQHRQFYEVFSAIRKGEVNSLQIQLGLRMDELGILRCHGRYQNAEIPEGAKCPKLLPRQEYFTKLLIQYVHERLIHAGVSHTLASLRQEYWIIKGRREVKSVLSRCLVCRRHEGPSFSLPRMPPWPRERVAQTMPFQFIGLDYMGPVLVKEGKEVIKSWICLFTCLSVCAIHLEWVKDLTPEQFLSCLRRFVARRGKPQSVISDNAPQFKVVKSAIDLQWRKVMLDDEVKQYMIEGGIKWQFTTALAPWQGGFYERLVGLVKRSLRKAMGPRRFTFEQLITILAEVEAIVNTRPLTYVYDDFDSGFTLTPAHFLMSRFQPLLLSTVDMDEDDDYYYEKNSATSLLDSWKRGQQQVNSFWEIWRNEYLLSLRERYSMFHRKEKNQIDSIPQVGQVVIIKEERIPRRYWKLGRIERLNISSDGEVRSADIYLPGNRNLQRSIKLLYPLEINEQSKNVTTDIDVTSGTQHAGSAEPTQRRIMPIRKAAQIAKQRISKCLEKTSMTVLFIIS